MSKKTFEGKIMLQMYCGNAEAIWGFSVEPIQFIGCKGLNPKSCINPLVKALLSMMFTDGLFYRNSAKCPIFSKLFDEYIA